MVAFFLFVVAQNQAGVFKVQHFEQSKIIEKPWEEFVWEDSYIGLIERSELEKKDVGSVA